jgi:hypothetical protein
MAKPIHIVRVPEASDLVEISLLLDLDSAKVDQ